MATQWTTWPRFFATMEVGYSANEGAIDHLFAQWMSVGMKVRVHQLQSTVEFQLCAARTYAT